MSATCTWSLFCLTTNQPKQGTQPEPWHNHTCQPTALPTTGQSTALPTMPPLLHTQCHHWHRHHYQFDSSCSCHYRQQANSTWHLTIYLGSPSSWLTSLQSSSQHHLFLPAPQIQLVPIVHHVAITCPPNSELSLSCLRLSNNIANTACPPSKLSCNSFACLIPYCNYPSPESLASALLFNTTGNMHNQPMHLHRCATLATSPVLGHNYHPQNSTDSIKMLNTDSLHCTLPTTVT